MSRKIVTPGDYIHNRRREVGITRGEMARLIGASDNRYRDIEGDDRRPTDEEIVAISRMLRIDPATLQRRYGRPASRRSVGGPVAGAPTAHPAPAAEVARLQEATQALERRIEAAIAATEELRRTAAEAKLAADREVERLAAAETQRAQLVDQLAEAPPARTPRNR